MGLGILPASARRRMVEGLQLQSSATRWTSAKIAEAAEETLDSDISIYQLFVDVLVPFQLLATQIANTLRSFEASGNW